MAAFTERRQALHDVVAGTLVVRRTFEPAAIEGAGLAPTSGLRTAGVVIGMLLLGPLGVGVMAVAIPAYQTFTIRAQIAEGIHAADAFKTAVSEAMAQNVALSKIDSQLLSMPTPENLKYVQSILVQEGSIIIEYGGQADAKIRGDVIVIIPGVDDNNGLVWVCGRGSLPSDATLSVEDGGRLTTVADAFLPPMCRGVGG
jgi:type IV pilus assembly protein PilA